MDALKKAKAINIGKRVAGTLSIPTCFILVLLFICLCNGRAIFETSTSFSTFLLSTGIIMMTTIALSINLGSGRFDFSLGSMAVLSMVLSSKISQALLKGGTGSAALMLFLSLLFGTAIGLVSGLIYVSLRIPPIIASLGVTLIFEGISYTISGGSYITNEVRNASMTSFSNGWYYTLILIFLVLGTIIYLFDFTRFGLNYKALKEGQRVSVNMGIKEVPNALACYAICGALMGIVGFLNALRSTLISAGSLNFASISIMFTAFLPMFVGSFIGRYSSDKLGYLLAAISMSFLNSTFIVFSNEVNSSVQSIINAALLVAFLIFLNNEQTAKDFIRRLFDKKENA